MQKESVAFKVIFLGQVRVGKTSIIRRLHENTFDERERGTIQAYQTRLALSIGAQPIELTLTDTAGEERYRSIAPVYFRDTDAAVLVFDITDPDSLLRVWEWYQDFLQHTRTRGGALPMLLLGNKVDITTEHRVKVDEARRVARQIGAPYYEVSAREDLGLQQAMLELGRRLLAHRRRVQHTHHIDQARTGVQADGADDPIYGSDITMASWEGGNGGNNASVLTPAVQSSGCCG